MSEHLPEDQMNENTEKNDIAPVDQSPEEQLQDHMEPEQHPEESQPEKFQMDTADQTEEMPEEEEQSFAELFESYDSGMGEDLQVGDKISGEVISIGKDAVFINTGTKIDGAVDRSELLDDEGGLTCQEGDVLELYVVSFDENEMKLSRALSGAGGLNMIRDAYNARVPVEGKVREECKGGFHVDVMGKRAFCPVSQIDIRYVETPADYVGGVFEFVITRFEEKGRNIVVSRRNLLQKEQEKAKKEFFETLNAGDDLEGRITNLMPYGAFVELTPGVEGMVHISEISWSRVENIEEVLRKNDRVRVKVLSIEDGKKAGDKKIALSIKQIAGDPWDTEAERFQAGEKVRGKVTRCMPFGAFVEIAPGIEGLVHISEMSYARRINKPEEVVTPGQETDVMIKEVDLEKRRISLSIRDAEGDPWINIGEKYKTGQEVKGIIENKEAFGFFITLEPGVTGLMPKSKMANSEDPSAIENLKVGDELTVTVDEIQPDVRKITLGPNNRKENDDWRKYAEPSAPKGGARGTSSGASGGGALGSLGELLQEAMNKKNK